MSRYSMVAQAAFAKYKAAADSIIAECKALNPGGEYVFIEADIGLIRTVDEVRARIKARKTRLDILFLSQGTASLERNTLAHYSRTQFIAKLLPLLGPASCLRRVVTVGAAGFEGPIDTPDFGALDVAPRQVRGHVATLITLDLEALARHAPSVPFHVRYRGWMSPTESGERHIYLLTSSRYPARNEDAGLVQLDGDGVSDADVIRGTDGKLGSGVYAVGLDGECVSMETLDFLDTLRKKEMVDLVWEHTVGVFERIAQTG
ncbi:uncharacterized protein BDW70DRAFT_153177 [Aspergillus foveolatus]|uniref:uncharacterized protein n=1 Tax=Aspergillus foveolatus TaxID=210207 RepID=UPI003CCD6440